MSDLSVMDNIKHYPNIFHLINYTKAKQKSQDAKYILEADTVKIKNDWVSEIQKELRQQFIQLKVLSYLVNNILTIFFFFRYKELKATKDTCSDTNQDRIFALIIEPVLLLFSFNFDYTLY